MEGIRADGLARDRSLMVSAEERCRTASSSGQARPSKDIGLTLKTEADASSHHMSVRRLADFPQDTFMLSRRQADGVVEWHENQADVFFVQSGSATLLLGGTMVGGEVTEPHEKRNGSIQGGSSANCRGRCRSHPPQSAPSALARWFASIHLLRPSK